MLKGRFYHVWQINEDDGLFECYDCNDSFDSFFIRIVYKYNDGIINRDVFERACEIAERELEMWMGGYTDLEDENEIQYYENIAVGEVVMYALNEAEIGYEIYFRGNEE